ncbi:hypothetical protein ACFLUO_06160 [Chloroflexota bacterium]
MKLSAEKWCKIQVALANLKCPHCFSAKIKLNEDDKENASCEDCGCKFDFNPDLAIRYD